MKMIDLLNKIANGEEVPKKIKYRNDVYILIDNYCYYCVETNLILSDRLYAEQSRLNDEVEILEEEKKQVKPLTKKDIETLGYACGEIQKCFTNGWTKSLENKPFEEEKKIPEKLDVISWDKCIHGVTHKEKELAIEINKTQETINEIIDYLKSKGDE